MCLNDLAAEQAARRGSVTELLRVPRSWKDENTLSFWRRDRERSLLDGLERSVGFRPTAWIGVICPGTIDTDSPSIGLSNCAALYSNTLADG